MPGDNVVIGLLGTGKIGSAVMSGFCTPVPAKSVWVPKAIYVSPRGTEKAKALHAKFPNKVTIASSNQDVLDHSNVVFIGLLPDVARQELPKLTFGANTTIISMMATIPYDELVQLVRLPKENVVRTVPLPSSSRRTGPILAYPKQAYVKDILDQIGTPVMVDTESEVTTLTGMTAMISFFYATCGHLQQWCVNNGVEESASRSYVASFFQSLADAGMISHEAFHDMAEEAATPGGLNEQTHRGLTATGAYDLILDQSPSASMLTVDEQDYFEAMMHEEMQVLVKQNYGVVLARVGSHPYWPARVCELEEWLEHVSHRLRRGQVCVYFYGSHNYGWTIRGNLHTFTEEHPSTKAIKKGSRLHNQYLKGLDQAKQAIASATALNATPFYERIVQKKKECEVDVPCSGCNRKGGDGLRIVCDGEGCDKEFHTSCLEPPLITIPQGPWYCPACSKGRSPSLQQASIPSFTSPALTTPQAKKHAEKPSTRKAIDSVKKTKSPPSKSTEQAAHADVESEERCFLCGLGGELVVCEFAKCTKVYHRLCLGAYPFPTDNDTEWICPRHTCAISGKAEEVVKSTMWHCVRCPVSIDDQALPNNAALTKMGRRDKSILCPHCVCPVAKVRLAKLLERMWSMIATNRQGLPFCGPLLPGIDRPECLENIKVLDLFQVLANIRSLKYQSAATFACDVQEVVDTALAIVNNRSLPLVEAAKSLSMVVEDQIKLYSSQLDMLRPILEDSGPDTNNQPQHVMDAVMEWPIAWRQECMPFTNKKGYVHTNARTLDEWTAYVTSAPLFADIGVPNSSSDCDVDMKGTESNADSSTTLSQLSSSMSLNDGIDVLTALSSLQQMDNADGVAAFQEDQAVLSMSTVEMDIMFKQQAALLRRVLQGHAALQHAWYTQQQNLLGIEQNHILTIGEGRLAAELRLANMNLKARLRAKDEIVQQLTADQLALTNELKAAKATIAKKEREIELLTSGEPAESLSPSGSAEKRRRSIKSPTDTPDSVITTFLLTGAVSLYSSSWSLSTMSNGWDCFDSSDDEHEPSIAPSSGLTPEMNGRVLAELLRVFPARRKAHHVDVFLPAAATIEAGSTSTAALQARLKEAGYVFPQDSAPKEVLIAMDALHSDLPYEALATVLKKLHEKLLPGGVLVTKVPPSLAVDFISELWAVPRIAVVSSSVSSFRASKSRHLNDPEHLQLVVVARRAGVVNPLHYRLESPSDKSLDIERNLVDHVTLGRSYSERLHGVLSVESHERACKILRECGVVILRGMYDPATVKAWGAAALKDFEKIAQTLEKNHDMDVFNPGKKPPSRNFVEFATREAFRCDIRHTPNLVALRKTQPKESERTSKEINPRHPIVVSILQDVAQPDGGALKNHGNYGMWNFSFGGPGSRQRLVHGEIGAIVSTPGCFDQKIHADIPHLFNTVDLPPHLLHAFMPACDEGGFEAGQTAFVVGSHFLETCGRMMNDDGSGIEETIANTIRPHVIPGDLVLFDCRVLHLGLSNTTAELGSKDGVRRAILYVNWHLPWFEDKKNWETTSLFP